MKKIFLIFLTLFFVTIPVVFAREIEDRNEVRKEAKTWATSAAKPLFLATKSAERREAREEVKEEIKTKIQDLKSKLLGMVVTLTGTVKSKGASSLVISVDSKDITINVDSNTKLRRKFWGVASFDEIQVNDTVGVVGKWTDETKTAVNALLVRDHSIQKVHGTFIGKVTSVSSTGFVIQTVERGVQTVTGTSTTKFVDRKEGVLNQSDIVVGHRVRVKGLWDKTNSTITEVTQVKDYDLPVRPSITPVASPTPI